MIFTRHKGAKPLSSTVSLRNGKFNLPNLILNHKTVDIIYFEEKIKIKTFHKEIGPVFALIGRLEENDVPFILLIDKKCQVRLSKSYTAVVNADCLAYKQLQEFFPEDKDVKNQDKSDLFNTIAKDHIEEFSKSFAERFEYFCRSIAYEDLIIKDLIFVAISSEDGNIYNLNKAVGLSFDNGKIWYFDEEYNYNSKIVDMIIPATKVDRVSEFSFNYETEKSYVNIAKLEPYTTAEVAEIVSKYPILFADLIKRNFSRYNKTAYELMEPLEEGMEEEDDRSFLDTLDEYEELEFNAPLDTKCCWACSNYFPKDQVKNVMVDKAWISLCEDCEPVPASQPYGFAEHQELQRIH